MVGATETTVASATHAFTAANQKFTTDVTGIYVPAAAGDQLVLRFSVSGAAGSSYTPNGDSDAAYPGGQIPHLTLPQ